MDWLLLATASALCSAAAAVTQKRVLFDVPALEFSFLVSLGILALSTFVPFTANVAAIAPGVLGVVVLKSALGGLAFLFVMRGLERDDISRALPLLGLTPAVTAVLAQLVLGDALHGAQVAGLVLMLAGTWVLETRGGVGGRAALRERRASSGHGSMLVAVLLFAVSTVADKLLVGSFRVPPLVVLFYQHVVYASLFAAMLAWRRRSWADLARGGRNALLPILAVAVFTIAYRWFQLLAVQVGPAALVLAVKRTSILYASWFGGRWLAERRLVPRVLAGALIVAAGFLFLGFE